MAHVASVRLSRWRATNMIKAWDYGISAFVLRWALLRRSDGSNILSSPTKVSIGQRHHRRRRRHCSTITTDTTPTEA
jgi:hypothetical protein